MEGGGQLVGIVIQESPLDKGVLDRLQARRSGLATTACPNLSSTGWTDRRAAPVPWKATTPR